MLEYAVDMAKSRGRHYSESSGLEGLFLEDRNRIVFSAAFRRLEYKTQVFVNHAGDHYRTRLTHSLEVGLVAKIIARHLSLNEDLAETIGLAHDLGHPPFGHAGEDALSDVMRQFGGFDHNFHTLKIVTVLEKNYLTGQDGFNLSYEILEGLIKHNGALDINTEFAKNAQSLLPSFDLHLNKRASLEAQVASLADDIAYSTHDLEDGFRSGMIQPEHLPIISNFTGVQIVSRDLKGVACLIADLRRAMIEDLLTQTRKNLKLFDIKTLEDIRNAPCDIVSFSDNMEAIKVQMKKFLMENIYRNYLVNCMRNQAKIVVQNLFNYFMEYQECLPPKWNSKLHYDTVTTRDKAIIIGDYIAGMTDRFIIEEYKRLFDPLYITHQLYRV